MVESIGICVYLQDKYNRLIKHFIPNYYHGGFGGLTQKEIEELKNKK